MEKQDLFEEILFPIEDLPMRIFGFEGKEGHPGYPFHYHHDAEVLYCVDGCIHVQIGQQKYDITQGKIMFIHPGEVHATYTEVASHVVTLQITHDFLSNLLQQIHFQVDVQKLLNHDHNEHLEIILQDMYYYQSISKKSSKIKLMSLLYDFCFYLVNNYLKPSKAQLSTQKNHDLFEKICEYIYQHQTENLTLNEIANVFNYTPTYLSSLFQKHLHVSFIEYLHRLRVDASVKLLLNTDYTLSLIAEKCGFSSLRSFNREFNKVYQMTPKAFRQKQDVEDRDGLKHKINEKKHKNS